MVVPTLPKYIHERDSNGKRLRALQRKIEAHATNPLDVFDAEHYITEADALIDDLTKLHTKILDACDAEHVDAHDEVHETLRDLYDSVSIGFKRIKAKLQPTNTQANQGSGSSSNDTKLPRLNLPTFSGEATEWMSFRDMFVAIVHSDASMPKAKKMRYLLTCLTGNAAKLVLNMAPTDAQYDIAWTKVTGRFDNQRELYFAVMRKFVSTPKASSENPNSIRGLVDAAQECERALESLNVEDKWDASLAYTLAEKLDPTSRQFWEMSLKETELPTSQQIIEFLEQRARSLSASGTKPKPVFKEHPPHQQVFLANPQSGHKPQGAPKRAPGPPKSYSCSFCNGPHPHFKCSVLLAMPIPDRVAAVKAAKLCYNCLRPGHKNAEGRFIPCTTGYTCHYCKKPHHTLLHIVREPPQPIPVAHVISEYEPTTKLLATAIVHAKDASGAWVPLRAFLDSGSFGQFLTEAALKRLGIPRIPFEAPLSGIGNTAAGSTRGVVPLKIRPRFPSRFSTSFDAFIMPVVTGRLPPRRLDPTSWSHLSGLQLADPQFHIPEDIDLLIGVEMFFSLLKSKKIPGPPGTPFAIETSLGWIVAGAANGPGANLQVNHAAMDLETSLQKFWEIETVSNQSMLTPEEKEAEQHFQQTHTRDASGRYVVQIPLKTPAVRLGSSRDVAVRRLHYVERRLEKNPKVREAYHEFMLKYETLGHMKLLSPSEKAHSPFRVFLPHHFVLPDEKIMSKFRVVFDASAKTSSGFSFNDAQLVGPTIQATLHTTLMRFRCNPIAFTADVAKMYRQVLVDPSQQDLQCILWRPSPSEPIKEYKLLTLTYGTASAPFLATRVLHQLAKDEAQKFPLASKAAERDFYVDDCMSGNQKVTQTQETIRQLRAMLEGAGMSLRKFASNDPEALRDVPPELKETTPVLSMEEDEVVKTLGLHWNTSTDQFFFVVKPFDSQLNLTKRMILSEIARLFDPMGWLAPCVISAKILIQEIWKEGTGWDECPSELIAHQWSEFKATMKTLEKIRIPRCIQPTKTESLELHGFCDASSKALAAVLFVRAKTQSGIVISNLTARTKVASLKTMSIPRLELRGALILAELIENVQESLDLKFEKIHCWTDSRIVLDWLNSCPSRWQVFVANRVAKIQEIMPRSDWSYVNTLENPADCASRGISPEELLAHPLWWNGPEFLKTDKAAPATQPPDEDISTEVLAEEKPVPILACAVAVAPKLIAQFSSLLKLKRVAGYCIRFVTNCRLKGEERNSKKLHGPLAPEELQHALAFCIRWVQQEEFAKEIDALSNQKPIPKSSKLLCLNPFLDPFGLLRVGGRLRNAEIPADQKTPILLPHFHSLTDLIIRDAHRQTMHGGPQLVQSFLFQTYWILRGKDAIRYLVKKCVVCAKIRATLQTQLMGDLPAARVNPSRPFTRTGVDYAGPFLLKTEAVRSKYTYKAYLALFVCFATRAIHLEIVSSLSSDAFISALKRFVARRGRPTDMYSDNGTNFVGANREMAEFIQLICSEAHNTIVSDHLSAKGIKWHFNPPSAPHMGGLWEAGVKSVKHHLHRIVGQVRLTFEELSTVVYQIEACLNSRPLTPFSSDPSDLTALTPAHFLTGGPLSAIPEPDFTETPVNRLKRWHHLQQLVQHFWQRWSQEFITRLQQRPKWMQPQREIQKDDLVLVKTDGLPPTLWPLARVLEIHPGEDGHVRVLTLKTQTSQMKRPITKTVLLPIDHATDVSEDSNPI